MKYLFIVLLCCFVGNMYAQQSRVVFDPERDTIARRMPDGSVSLHTPIHILNASLSASLNNLTDYRGVQVKKLGRSQYLTFKATSKQNMLIDASVAILLTETTPGVFQADQLMLTCSGTCGDCGEDPTRACGCCGQSSSSSIVLATVTSNQH
jgi:hypothetical protein